MGHNQERQTRTMTTMMIQRKNTLVNLLWVVVVACVGLATVEGFATGRNPVTTPCATTNTGNGSSLYAKTKQKELQEPETKGNFLSRFQKIEVVKNPTTTKKGTTAKGKKAKQKPAAEPAKGGNIFSRKFKNGFREGTQAKKQVANAKKIQVVKYPAKKVQGKAKAKPVAKKSTRRGAKSAAAPMCSRMPSVRDLRVANRVRRNRLAKENTPILAAAAVAAYLLFAGVSGVVGGSPNTGAPTTSSVAKKSFSLPALPSVNKLASSLPLFGGNPLPNPSPLGGAAGKSRVAKKNAAVLKRDGYDLGTEVVKTPAELQKEKDDKKRSGSGRLGPKGLAGRRRRDDPGRKRSKNQSRTRQTQRCHQTARRTGCDLKEGSRRCQSQSYDTKIKERINNKSLNFEVCIVLYCVAVMD